MSVVIRPSCTEGSPCIPEKVYRVERGDSNGKDSFTIPHHSDPPRLWRGVAVCVESDVGAGKTCAGKRPGTHVARTRENACFVAKRMRLLPGHAYERRSCPR